LGIQYRRFPNKYVISILNVVCSKRNEREERAKVNKLLKIKAGKQIKINKVIEVERQVSSAVTVSRDV